LDGGSWFYGWLDGLDDFVVDYSTFGFDWSAGSDAARETQTIVIIEFYDELWPNTALEPTPTAP
jgi:hypothetical protein